MSRGRLAHALPIAALAAAPVLPAQRPSGVEVGAFASLASFTPRFDLRAGLGGGGRIGYYLQPAWALELEGNAQRATVEGGGRSVPILLAGAHVQYNLGSARPTWFVVGGYAHLRFHGTPPGQFGDDAVALGVGRRVFLGERLALRGDLRGLYTFSSHRAPGKGAGHLLATVGLSYFTTGGPPPDADHDGVPDGRDVCRQTPDMATVDRTGCPMDSDADGHADGLDRCPNTPLGAFADSRGCPVDSDADGVYDGLDQCPNTMAGSAIDPHGCPRDADGDGVDDARDRCPETPPGAAVDLSGCLANRDADGDGVEDARDQCPGTPTATPVDAVGCQVLFQNEGEALVLRGVNFETGRSRLLTASHVVLNQVAASLLAHPEVRIEIAGYTDSTGSAAMNTRLSAARAQVVRDYLARRGVSPERMRAKGYGPANPLATNETPAGRALNRRVELHQVF